eukprot:2260984-Prymnesium_polylepis.1
MAARNGKPQHDVDGGSAVPIFFCPPPPHMSNVTTVEAMAAHVTSQECWTRMRKDGIVRISPQARPLRHAYDWGRGAQSSIAWAQTVTAAICSRTQTFAVPLPNMMLRRALVSASVAMQLSGHLQDCDFRWIERNLAACRLRFTRCDVFVHTWSTLRPLTTSWRGPGKPSATDGAPVAACLERMKKALQPVAVQVCGAARVRGGICGCTSAMPFVLLCLKGSPSGARAHER